DAGLRPRAARPDARPLAHHHRVAFIAERARVEHERDRQDAFVALAARAALAAAVAELDAGEVLAVMSADHLGDAKQPIAVLARFELHEALPVALLQDHAIVFETKLDAVERRLNARAERQPRHLMHRRTRPVAVDRRVAALARLRSGVIA